MEQAGWSVQRDAEGNLILRPGASGGGDSGTDQWQRLQGELRATGWNVDREADGTLLLLPPGPSAPAPGEVADPMHDIKQKLRQTGWSVSSSPDGSMLLYPPGRAQKPDPAAGVVSQARIALPVNNWQEAYDISVAWLESQPDYGASVGRIRRLFRVHLVSIVSKEPPHRLLQQIAIRNRDGAVIVLN